MKRFFSLGILLAAAMFLLSPPDHFAFGWDHYKYSQPEGQLIPVPDVNKPDRDLDGFWPDANDMSCWQACASNLLAAAGYGTNAANPTPQGRADAIYGQLNNDLGFLNCGLAERAINYWLYTYGKNPNSAEFQPGNPYTDVTVKSVYSLNMVDYQFLMGELDRCQYVAVSFDDPAHCMTLVGGNDPVAPGAGNDWVVESVWHDSDRNNVPPGDDLYVSNFGQNGLCWNLPGYPAWNAQKYVTFCQGLNKDEDAMRNYDVAYFLQDTDQDGTWDPDFREAGDKVGVYTSPSWLDDNIVEIGNERIDDLFKEIYLLVDYTDRIAGRQEDITLKTVDPEGTEVELDPTSVTASEDDGQLLFCWKLDYQPDWEQIVFPDARYSTLMGNVKDWDVATKCVPEPGVLVLLAVALLMLVPRLRRRK